MKIRDNFEKKLLFIQRVTEALALMGTHKMVWFQQLTVDVKNLDEKSHGLRPLDDIFLLNRKTRMREDWMWTEQDPHLLLYTPRHVLESGSGSSGSVNNWLSVRIRILTFDQRFSKHFHIKTQIFTIFNGIKGPQNYPGRFPNVDPARPVILWPL